LVKKPAFSDFCMRSVSYGDPEAVFGNPNLRWGSPSYLLEPGDPGYVSPISVNPKQKRMKHNRYYPDPQPQQVIWLANFKGKLPGYATTPLGLAAGVATAAVADAGWVKYLLEDWLPAVRAWSKACTDALTAAQTGTGSSAMTLPVFTAPALPSGVTPQLPGSLDRIFALVQQIKKSGKSTDAINDDLKIIGTEESGPDLSTVMPVISAKPSGSEVHLTWGYQGHGKFLEACEIQVDRGTGTFALLTIDTTPNYTDTQPWPATKTIWTYKAIYRAADAQVGHWSQTVSVTVGG
jgi:hypothetical protein